MKLSKREIEILKLLADGYSGKEIAGMLYVTLKTVEKHKENMLEKTHAKNTPHMIAIAFRAGMIAISLFLWQTAVWSQTGRVFQTGPAYVLPDKLDTFAVKMLVSEKKTGWFTTSNAYEIDGFMILGGNQWEPVYLDSKKKRFSASITVWMAVKK